MAINIIKIIVLLVLKTTRFLVKKCMDQMYRIARKFKRKLLYVLTLRFIFDANQHENGTKRKTEDNNHRGLLRTVTVFPLGLISKAVNGIKDSTYGIIQNNSGTEKSEEKIEEINQERGLLASIIAIPIKLISQPIVILNNSYDIVANNCATEETRRDAINNKGYLATITAIPRGIISQGIQGIRNSAYNIITEHLTRKMGIDLIDKEE